MKSILTFIAIIICFNSIAQTQNAHKINLASYITDSSRIYTHRQLDSNIDIGTRMVRDSGQLFYLNHHGDMIKQKAFRNTTQNFLRYDCSRGQYLVARICYGWIDKEFTIITTSGKVIDTKKWYQFIPSSQFQD